MKRKILSYLLLLSLLLSLIPTFSVDAASTASTGTVVGDKISVMSFNVLDYYDTKDSDGNYVYDAPAAREKVVVDIVKTYKPDILGIQEAGKGSSVRPYDWCTNLTTDLKSIYSYRSLTDDTGLALGICRGLIIFYNKTRFTKISSGGQGYTTPANNKRAFQWVKLKDKQTNVEFYVFNTHLHVDANQTIDENSSIRYTEMQELVKKVKSVAGSTHFFITGDFNSAYTRPSSTSSTDGTTIGKVMSENANFGDGLVDAKELYNVDASGNKTAWASTHSTLQKCVDHVLYNADFYTANTMRRIYSGYFTPRPSDHSAILVDFTYNQPTITATSDEGELSAYYANGAYYIDNMAKRTSDLAISVQLSKGTIYKDSACTTTAGNSLTIKCATSKTYRSENTYYIKFGSAVYPLYLRSCNDKWSSATTYYVDKSIAGKTAGEKGLYCDKWYCLEVTTGVNGFATIQEAVNAAQEGYRIFVAPGTYTENISYSGKSLHFYGSNRNNVKALTLKDGVLTVNSSRTYETYISGSISYNCGSLKNSNITVNGFHFIDRTATAQIYFAGGDANKTLTMRISNNLFNCYTDGAPNNGSVVLGVSSVQKIGVIEDNYFHLTKIPTYTNDSGKTVNYTNRGITLRNLRDLTVNANYFDGYSESYLRPFWFSSEVSSGSTTAGYGNLAFTANRIENSLSGIININNVRGSTSANLLIAGNSYGTDNVDVNFSDTANQTSQNLPTDMTKVKFYVQTSDYPNLAITPATGISCTKFSYYVTFRSEDGTSVYAHSIVSGTTATYGGTTPTKAATASNHYQFANWVDANKAAVDLKNIKATTDVYASFTASAHTTEVRDQLAPTCTENGYSGDTYCKTCGYLVKKGSSIAANGHTAVNDPAVNPTCTKTGLTEGSHCSVCNAIVVAQELVDASGHSYSSVVTNPTCTTAGYTTYTCTVCGDSYIADETEVIGHSYSLVVTKPTCTTAGYTSYTCTVCGDSYIADETEVIGHSYNAVVTKPTCTTAGYTTYTCTVCGDSYIADETIALGHSYNSGEITTAPTCTDNGVFTYTCIICGDTMDEALAAHGHSMVLREKQATCTEDGYNEHYHCTICDGNFFDIAGEFAAPWEYLALSATGHSHNLTNNGADHIIGCANCDFSVSEEHNYIDGTCICGAIEVIEPKYEFDASLTYSMSISVGSEMQVKYTIPTSKVKTFKSFYLEVVKEVYGGESVKTVYSLDNENLEATMHPVSGAVVGYAATYTGIFASQMGDDFTATLYAVAEDGTIYYGNAETSSIKSSLYEKIASGSEELKTLAVDMLNYGAAAQIFFDYNVENLVNSDLTEEQKALGTQTIPDAADNSAITGDGCKVTTSVSLQSKVLLYINCTYTSNENSDLMFVIKDLDGNILEEFAPSMINARVCQGIYDNVGAKQMRDLVTIELYDNGNLVSKTITWNIESYVAQTRATSTEEAKINAVNAMLIYGDSAAVYLESTGQ